MTHERLKKFIGFFLSEEKKNEYIEIPDADNFDKGLLFCCKCGEKLEFQEGLKIEKCPACKTALYIPILINDYLIYKPLGSGGEGFVYKARKLNSEKKFAIKLIPPSKQSIKELNDKLIREARIIEKIGKHKNITELIEYGIFKEIPFVVFKLINGERLDEYVSKRKNLSEKKALSFIMQIIEAEKHIISSGFLYRDLKPENILIEKGGIVKICDFGISLNLQELSTHRNSSDEFEGSPYYIPPERILGQPENEYSEIYSLGMLAFYMLHGSPYFTDTEINMLISRHIQPELKTKISEKLTQNNQKLVYIIEKMTHYLPSERYQTLNELSNDLEKLREEIFSKPTIYLQTKTKKINISDLKK